MPSICRAALENNFMAHIDHLWLVGSCSFAWTERCAPVPHDDPWSHINRMFWMWGECLVSYHKFQVQLLRIGPRPWRTITSELSVFAQSEVSVFCCNLFVSIWSRRDQGTGCSAPVPNWDRNWTGSKPTENYWKPSGSKPSGFIDGSTG